MYTVSIQCDVTDAAALEREARRLAKASGLTDQDFDYFLKTDYTDPISYCLGWLFDHGSPLAHGVQIEQTDVDANAHA